ncbi:uncharacterized protein GGS25DRAFT_531944 [Hypoxylon fragiforme]|uniref:uncharacterized protein n=1 Tax=Hypoxylon fragiforme TaxID=63214 RepID=UPI0020C6EF8B|nr:uncharacterized protein GGS25DRAFT_531944 [Hypoxylon fragiforme]KAI2609038.1 hypothetical protein GGS25DRAFT_531944 [Hypoxylon fragiforme]
MPPNPNHHHKFSRERAPFHRPPSMSFLSPSPSPDPHSTTTTFLLSARFRPRPPRLRAAVRPPQTLPRMAWHQLRDRLSTSLIVVCEAGADWLTDDGVRCGRGEWIATYEEFCRVLEEQGLECVVLPCDLDTTSTRVAFVLKHWMRRRKDGL